jgi:lipid II:glycine glycyltransferase (peptidoglycan interpeptide bridge formation enzyme)
VRVDVRPIEDRDGWDSVLAVWPGADLRQTWAWGQVRSGQGWTPLRLAAAVEGRPVAALAVQTRSVPWLGTIAYAPRGPVMDVDDERAWRALPALARAVRAATGAAFVRLSPGLDDSRFDVAARLREAGFVRLGDFWTLWNTPRNVMRLDVSGPERAVLARMARKRRQHISTAARRGVRAVVVPGAEALAGFYALLADHAARQRYPIRDRAYFEALHAAFAPGGALALVNGLVEGQVVCALLGVRVGPVAYALSAPSAPQARGTAVGDVVHWEWIRWARAAGCREIDFGSSGRRVAPAASDPAGGIYRFKIELGCTPRLCMGYHDYVFEPRRHRLLRAVETAAATRARFWLDRLPAGVRLRLAQRVA